MVTPKVHISEKSKECLTILSDALTKIKKEYDSEVKFGGTLIVNGEMFPGIDFNGYFDFRDKDLPH